MQRRRAVSKNRGTELERGAAMPQVITVGTRAPGRWLVRLVEPLIARLGWLTGRVPVGVTPTLSTSHWWR
jgi:hypothetical protein